MLASLQFCLMRIVWKFISFPETERTKTVEFCTVLLTIWWNIKYLLRSMSCGNYINLLNWSWRGLGSLNQGHPNFAQLRAVLASCLELEAWISLIIADLLFNTELQLMQISSKLERKIFLLPALEFGEVGGRHYILIVMSTMESTAFLCFTLNSVHVPWFQDKLVRNV